MFLDRFVFLAHRPVINTVIRRGSRRSPFSHMMSLGILISIMWPEKSASNCFRLIYTKTNWFQEPKNHKQFQSYIHFRFCWIKGYLRSCLRNFQEISFFKSKKVVMKTLLCRYGVDSIIKRKLSEGESITCMRWICM